ncbi:hypothetical protein [Serinicoccus chungangensis]|uniref:hypothetical protein n=1 Tax=Serinicoccus chungangensis TaxID=767452 RepID=UPI001930F03D|nr:hypothetical protein [Serinicoccus chungangensis]
MSPIPRVSRPATRWRLVVPVQRAERAKTRLVAPEGVGKVALARAIAADTLDAVCRALTPGDVVVVTSDRAGAALAAGLGARVVDDPGAGSTPRSPPAWRRRRGRGQVASASCSATCPACSPRTW